MTWVKLDDGFAGHPKMEAVGPLAGWLHVAVLCHSAQYLTDGTIHQVKALKLTDVPNPRRHIGRLIDEGVWHCPGHDCDICRPCPEDHYLVHDYLHYQRSRDDVMAERAAAAERQRKARERAKSQRDADDSHGVSHAVTNGVSHSGSHGPPDPTRPDQSRPVPSPAVSNLLFSLVNRKDGTERDPRVVEALQLMADEALAKKRARVKSPGAFWFTCLKSALRDHLEHLDELADTFPEHEPLDLMVLAEGGDY